MLPLNTIKERMEKLDNWGLEADRIVKDLSFESFERVKDFINKLFEVAEKHKHHPDIMISFTTVRISLTTHEEKGLTLKDFEVAEEIDRIYK